MTPRPKRTDLETAHFDFVAALPGAKDIAVVCDNWKLPIFKELLTTNRFEFKVAGELAPGVTSITVHLKSGDEMHRLKAVVEACERSAQEQKERN